MTLPPAWKIRREILRVLDRARFATARIAFEPGRKIYHDLTAPYRQRVTEGDQPLSDRVAVFVVFQPKGIPRSIQLTLDHLRLNGFSVLVVSNGPLRPDDRAALVGNASVVLERPNVGYDFGGYRDGIRHLWGRRKDFSRLVLLNDSTWFPLRRDDDSLARMEHLGVDLAGQIYKIEDEAARRRDHLESHLLLFSQAAVRSDEFRRFWSGYRMSDHRSTTIEVGEKGLSQMALRSGWSVAALMSSDWLLSTLRQMDEAQLRAVLDHTIDSFRGRQKGVAGIRRAAAQGKRWHQDFLTWVEGALSNSRTFMISATFVMPALVYGRMGFAKKTKDIRFHLARQKLLDLEASGMIPPIDSAVRDEIVAAVRDWTPPKGTEPGAINPRTIGDDQASPAR